MWRSDVFEWHGKYYDIPPTPIIPKPMQRPHPPIYVACSRVESVITAGQLGVGSLNFTAGNDEQLLQKIRVYREAIAATTAPRSRINNQFCCTPACLVLPDDRAACEHGFRGARFFAEALATYFFSPTGSWEHWRFPVIRYRRRNCAEQMARRSTPGSQLINVIGIQSRPAKY